MRKTIFIIIITLVLLILILAGGGLVMLNTSKGQTFLSTKALEFLSRKTSAAISFQNLKVDMYDEISVDHFLMRDLQQDTLLYAGKLYVDVSLLELLSLNVFLDNILLEDLRIKQYALADSKTNASFLLGASQKDTLSLPSTRVEATSPAKAAWADKWDFGINKIVVSRLHLSSENEFTEKNLYILASGFETAIEALDLRAHCLSLSSLTLRDPQIRLTEYLPTPDDNKDKGSFKIGDLGWDINVRKLDITGGSFAYHKDRSPAPQPNIDFNNLDLKEVEMSLADFSLDRSEINIHINGISLKERSGFQLKKLEADLLFTDTEIDLQKLWLETPYSLLRESLHFSFENLDAFGHFIQDVGIKATLKDAALRMKDLAFFMPATTIAHISKYIPLNQKLTISGIIKGSVDNFRGTDLYLSIGPEFSFEGKVKMTGLPDFNNTFIDLKVNQLKTHTDQIKRLLSGVKLPVEVMRLGEIQFNGNFTGFTNDFVASGKLFSSLGSVQTDLNMKAKGTTSYRGEITLDAFDMGALLAHEKLGKASLNLNLNGRGLNIKDLNASMVGQVRSFYFNGYEYQHITLDGRFDSKLFEGKIISNDPHLAINFDGKVDLNNPVPAFEFKSNVIRADLQALKLVKEPISFTSLADMKISGNDIDNLVGNATLQNLVLTKEDKNYLMDEVILLSSITGDRRKIIVKADFLDADFNGRFSFKELPAAFNAFLSTYFPYNFIKPEKSSPVDLTFNIDVKDPIRFSSLFLPQLESLTSATAQGHFNNENGKFTVYLDVPSMTIEKIKMDTLRFMANAGQGGISYKGSLGKILLNEKTAFPEILLEGDVADYKLNYILSAGRKNDPNKLVSKGQISVKKDTLSLALQKLDLLMGDLLWTSEGGNIVYLNKDYYSIDEIVLKHQDQYVKVFSHLKDNLGGPLNLELNDIEIPKLMGFIGKDADFMNGVANATISIDQPLKNPVVTGRSSIDKFYFLKKEIGDVYINAEMDAKNKKVRLDGGIAGTHNQATLDGYYVFDKTRMPLIRGKTSNIDIQVAINKFELNFLEALIGDANISGTVGDATGTLALYGDIKSPRMDATLNVREASTTFNLLNDHFFFYDQQIAISDNRIMLDGLTLTDRLGNKAYAKGSLHLNDFKSLYVDAQLDTPSFLLMDTNGRRTDAFYGTAIGRGSLMFNGPLNNVYIYVYAQTGPQTHILLPLSEQAAFTAKNETYTFTKKIVVAKDSLPVKKKSAARIRLEMDLEITTDARMELIFDDVAGDKIESRGNGNVIIDYSSEGQFDMYGDYVIDSGQYLFTFQSISNKPFEINKGGKIQFTGDPYKAILDITAIYKSQSTGVDLLGADAFASSGDNSLNKAFKADIYMFITGELSSPDIAFRIELPDRSSVPDEVERTIEGINNDIDKNELNRQVFGLLIFKKFFPITSDALLEGGLGSVINNLSELVSSQFSRLLNETLSEFIPNSDFNVKWSMYDQQSTDATQSLSRNEIDLVYSQRFFNDRISIDLEGNFDVGKEDANLQQNNVALAGDFVFQYRITEDGHYRVKIFNKYDEDFIAGRYNKAGVALFINEEFDDFRDLRERQRHRREMRLLQKKQKQERRLKEEESLLQ